jgi:hypothetical protein
MAAVKDVAQAFTTAKSKTNGVATLIPIAQLPIISASGSAARSIESASAPGPAKYLLFQTFRI